MSENEIGIGSVVGFVASVMSIIGITIFPSHAIFPASPVINTDTDKTVPGTPSIDYVKPVMPQEKKQPEISSNYQDNQRKSLCSENSNTDWSYYSLDNTPVVWKCSNGAYFAFQCYNGNVYLISDGDNIFTGAYVYQHDTYRPDYDQQLSSFLNNELNYHLLAQDKDGVDQFYVFRNAQYVEMLKLGGKVRVDLDHIARLTKKYFPTGCIKETPL